jgi:hypothetical protein
VAVALQVAGEYETPAGVTVPSTYWRWVGLGIDVAHGHATLTLYAYVSAEAFAAGKQPIGQREYRITGEEFALLAGRIDGPTPEPLSVVAYDYVRAVDPYFAGATEV